MQTRSYTWLPRATLGASSRVSTGSYTVARAVTLSTRPQRKIFPSFSRAAYFRVEVRLHDSVVRDRFTRWCRASDDQSATTEVAAADPTSRSPEPAQTYASTISVAPRSRGQSFSWQSSRRGTRSTARSRSPEVSHRMCVTRPEEGQRQGGAESDAGTAGDRDFNRSEG